MAENGVRNLDLEEATAIRRRLRHVVETAAEHQLHAPHAHPAALHLSRHKG